jgi:hypothetical protein
MAEGISLRDFGKRVGLSPEAVRKAIATGKIPRDCLGTRQAGTKTWPTITDPAKAEAAWRGARDETQVRDKAAQVVGAKRAHAIRRGEDPRTVVDTGTAPPPDDDDAPAPAPGAAGAATGAKRPSITDSKEIQEAYKARIAKLDYEERVGKLVNADQVKVKFANMVTSARNGLMGVPSKAKAKIPTLTVRDIEVLEDLIAHALEEVALGG